MGLFFLTHIYPAKQPKCKKHRPYVECLGYINVKSRVSTCYLHLFTWNMKKLMKVKKRLKMIGIQWNTSQIYGHIRGWFFMQRKLYTVSSIIWIPHPMFRFPSVKRETSRGPLVDGRYGPEDMFIKWKGSTWRIIPVNKWLVTPIYAPCSPIGRGTTPLRGLTNHGH